MSDDLISRQAASVELSTMLKECFAVDDEIIDAVHTTLQETPSAQQWTPVSNPPKESDFYLVTVRRSGYDELVKIKWFDSELNLWSMVDLYVPIAWMPLPEPYKEEN